MWRKIFYPVILKSGDTVPLLLCLSHCSVLNLSITAVGLLPYNFICVQTGVMLSEVSSLDDLFSWERLLQLLAIACMALVPGALIRRLSQKRLKLDVQSSNGLIPEKKAQWLGISSISALIRNFFCVYTLEKPSLNLECFTLSAPSGDENFLRSKTGTVLFKWNFSLLPDVGVSVQQLVSTQVCI